MLFPYSVPGGELFERIVAEEYLMEDDAVDYVRQILEALRFMHERNVVHLDLKVGGTDFLSHWATELPFPPTMNLLSLFSWYISNLRLHPHVSVHFWKRRF